MKKLIIAALGKHMTLQIFLAITNPLSFHYLLYLLNERGTRGGSVLLCVAAMCILIAVYDVETRTEMHTHA